MVAADERLQYQQFYLNPTYYYVRAVIYFLIWLWVAYLLSAWSRREDASGDVRWALKAERFAGFGLLLYGVTLHFSAFDWIQSLQPTFHSTIFPPIVAVGGILAGQAFAVLVLCWLMPRPPLAGLVSFKALNDLGNLLLTFLIIWAYLVWFQFMLVWIADLPAEARWYVLRETPGWRFVAWLIFLLHFCVPFFLLLLRTVKRNHTYLRWTASLVFGMQLVYFYYQVMPSSPNTALSGHWMDFLTPIGVGGIWLAYFLQQLKSAPLLPLHDRNQKHALELRRSGEEEAAREARVRHG
jgi:hypothetical protein